MFQYTSETIINSNAGKLKTVGASAGVRFAAVAEDGYAIGSGHAVSDAATLMIDGVVALKKKDIKRVYKTPYMAEELAVAEITVPAVTAGEVLRLVVRIGEQGRTSSILQNAYLKKSRPFVYEVVATGTAATDAAAFVSLVEKEMAETDFKFFVAENTGAKITLTAEDCYTRFVDNGGIAVPVGGQAVVVEEIDTTANNILGYEQVKSTTHGEVKVFGNQGAGTVARLIKDLRIPTSAKIDPFELKDGGMPVPGGKYTQYLVEVETDRRQVSGGVVGELGKSLTSFVFFIESGAVSDFDELFTALGISVNLAGVPAVDGVAEGAHSHGASATAKASITGAEDVVVANDNKPAGAKDGEVVFNKKA